MTEGKRGILRDMKVDVAKRTQWTRTPVIEGKKGILRDMEVD